MSEMITEHHRTDGLLGRGEKEESSLPTDAVKNRIIYSIISASALVLEFTARNVLRRISICLTRCSLSKLLHYIPLTGVGNFVLTCLAKLSLSQFSSVAYPISWWIMGKYQESHECTRQKGTHVPIRSWYPFPLVAIAGIELAECGDMSRMAGGTKDGMGSERHSSVSTSDCARRRKGRERGSLGIGRDDKEKLFSINRPTNPAATIDRRSWNYYTCFQRIVSPLLHGLRVRKFKQSIYRRLFCFL